MLALFVSASPPSPRALAPAPPPAVTRQDLALVARCQAREAGAFEAFVKAHERQVFALLSRMLGRGSHVEDLAQETFLRAFRAIGGFDLTGTARVSTWLLTIATRLALDARRGKRDTVDIDDTQAASLAPGPEGDTRRRELGRDLERAALSLPDDQRAALLLSEVHGLSVAEVAQALEIPENTVKTRLFRAREKMRAALEKDWSPR